MRFLRRIVLGWRWYAAVRETRKALKPRKDQSMPKVPLTVAVTVIKDGNALDPWFQNTTRIHVPQEGGKAFVFRMFQDQAARADKGKQGDLDVFVTVDGAPVPGLEAGIQKVTYKEWEKMRRTANKAWDDIADDLMKDGKKDKKHK